jgi:hypothetical protein
MNMIIKPKRKSRLQCVREIRDKALKIVSAEGSWTGRGWRGQRQDFDIPFLSISYEPSGTFSRRPSNISGLDIWLRHKVLNIEWDEQNSARIISFRRGPWEDLILTDWADLSAAVLRGETVVWGDNQNGG